MTFDRSACPHTLADGDDRWLSRRLADDAVRFDNVLSFRVIDHCHHSVADDDFKDISRERRAVQNPDFLLVGEGDLHGSFPQFGVMIRMIEVAFGCSVIAMSYAS